MGTPEDVAAEKHFTPPDNWRETKPLLDKPYIDLKGVKHYPECEKMHACHEKSQACGEFLEWLENSGIVLAHYAKYEEWGSSELLVPVHRSVERLLAEFFGIDLKKVEAEKREMLDDIRNLNAVRASGK